MLLGQVATEEKSNEITAIPKLIEMLDIRRATITIDAMGCQKAIAEQIVDKEGDYVLTLKGNQGTLHESVTSFFDDARKTEFENIEYDVHEDIDKDHGRIEVRKVFSTQQVDSLEVAKDWKGLKSIVMIESTRIIGNSETFERRYAISSHAVSAEILGGFIRGHWGVENTLHWTLDVTFREDSSRVRDRNAAANLSILRKIALNLVKNEPTKKKLSMRAKRKVAGWDHDYLLALVASGIAENQGS